jgi:hypothetical protein
MLRLQKYNIFTNKVSFYINVSSTERKKKGMERATQSPQASGRERLAGMR